MHPFHDVLEVETLEPRIMLSTVQILAAGTTGTELIELEINGTVVQTWNDIGDQAYNGQTVTRSWSTAATVSANQVRINFVNDLYNPSAGFDRNVRVDAIVIDGVRYDAEDPGVFSSGTWIPGNGISSGFLQNEFLHSNGHFQFANSRSSDSTVEVYARGTEGGEQFRVWVDGVEAGNGTATTTFQTFQFALADSADPNQVRIEFTNDLYDATTDRNLIVDYITVDGQVFQSEDPQVFSTGTWTASDGISPGFRQSEWLHGNGFLEFSIEDGSDDNQDDGSSPDIGDAGDAFERLNDVLPDGWTWQLFSNGTNVHLQTFDAAGNPAFNFRFGTTGVISSIVDLRNNQQLLAPTYQGEITDRVVQSVLWEVGPTVRHDVPSLSNDQDRFNLTQAGTKDNRLNRTVDVDIDSSSGQLNVWAVTDQQWESELQPHITGSANMLTSYQVLDSGAILIRRVMRVGDITLNGQAVELSNPILVGWFPWADSAFNSMALGISPQGVPNHWYANGQNIPNHQNQPIGETRGWAMVYDRNNVSGGATMSVIHGLDAGTVHRADGSTVPMRRMLFNSLDFDTGIAFDTALWPASLPAGSIIDQSYIMVPGRGIQPANGSMLDTLATELPPPQVYHPGAAMDAEMAAIADRLAGLAQETGYATDQLGTIV